ncbi:MAG: DUF6265 family protein [Acidobacteriota bacterium]
MLKRRIVTPCLTLLFLSLVALPRVAKEKATAADVSIGDFAWIVGDWQGEKGGGLVEEQWSAAGGGAMMGMFRWLAGDEVRLYEFLLIESGPEGPMMRIKHFNPGMVGWEEKEQSLEFHLESLSPNRAVFAMDPAVEDTQLIYELQDGGSGLSVSLVKNKPGGKESVTRFDYSRQ